VPFVSGEIFRDIYWATLKPIVEEIWAAGHQVLFCSSGTLGAVRTCVKTVIERVAKRGGYIMDASALIMDDAKPEQMSPPYGGSEFPGRPTALVS
jgi:hypothetical protein